MSRVYGSQLGVTKDSASHSDVLCFVEHVRVVVVLGSVACAHRRCCYWRCTSKTQLLTVVQSRAPLPLGEFSHLTSRPHRSPWCRGEAGEFCTLQPAASGLWTQTGCSGALGGWCHRSSPEAACNREGWRYRRFVLLLLPSSFRTWLGLFA